MGGGAQHAQRPSGPTGQSWVSVAGMRGIFHREGEVGGETLCFLLLFLAEGMSSQTIEDYLLRRWGKFVSETELWYNLLQDGVRSREHGSPAESPEKETGSSDSWDSECGSLLGLEGPVPSQFAHIPRRRRALASL